MEVVRRACEEALRAENFIPDPVEEQREGSLYCFSIKCGVISKACMALILQINLLGYRS